MTDMATTNGLDVSTAMVSEMSNGSDSSTPPPPPAAAAPSSSSPSSSSSCRRKKSEGDSFVQDIRDHFDEFVHASMDEHKACFKNTLKKMFRSSKNVENVSAASPPAPVESVLPLNSTTSSS